MSDKSISECQSKIDPGIPKTGRKSVNQSGKEPQTVAKEAPPTLDAAPKTESLTPSQEAPLCSPSRTLTTTPKTASRKTSGRCASGATSPTTPDIMQKQESDARALSVTTSNRRSLVGKNKKRPTRNDLMRALHGDELGLQLHQIQLEAYKPAMDACKLYLDIYGSSSPNFYRTQNLRVMATCQMNGINDPDATRKQRIAAMTCYEMIHETIIRCLELGLDKEQVKQELSTAIEKAGEFFGLGNKKAVKARERAKKKEQAMGARK